MIKAVTGFRSAPQSTNLSAYRVIFFCDVDLIKFVIYVSTTSGGLKSSSSSVYLYQQPWFPRLLSGSAPRRPPFLFY